MRHSRGNICINLDNRIIPPMLIIPYTAFPSSASLRGVPGHDKKLTYACYILVLYCRKRNERITSPHIPARRGLLAISPILVFLFFYLAVSVIIGDFYKMPIAVALLLRIGMGRSNNAWQATVRAGRDILPRRRQFQCDVYGVDIHSCRSLCRHRP